MYINFLTIYASIKHCFMFGEGKAKAKAKFYSEMVNKIRFRFYYITKNITSHSHI